MPKNIVNFTKAEKKLRISNKSATSAEIILYAGIGQDFWGDGSMVSAKEFSDQLKALDPAVNELTVRINSPGGDVFDGIAIYNRLNQFKGTVKVYIDGLAASIASIIALAGDEIIIGDGALYMIHLPWTWAVGNRMELDNTVNRLMDVEDQLIGIYAKKSGMDKNEVKSLLEAETWMDADQAIELGFVDEKMEDTMPIAASAMNSRWMNKAPTKYFSEAKAIENAKKDLKEKIQNRLARK